MMQKSGMLGVGCLLWAVAAFGQASLPAFYSGPWSSVTLPTGWTKNGLGGDYGTDYDSSGGMAAKFDSAGDWIKIQIASSRFPITCRGTA